MSEEMCNMMIIFFHFGLTSNDVPASKLIFLIAFDTGLLIENEVEKRDLNS